MKATTESLTGTLESIISEFKNVNDLNLYVTPEGVIKGGFYKMQYTCPVTGDLVQYFFHEIFYRTSSESTEEAIAEYIRKRIKSMLAWQRNCDELYAEEMGKPVVYRYS